MSQVELHVTAGRGPRGPGAAWKDPARAASTASLTLAGEQTVDGVVLVDDDRVLVKDQASPEENGIYVVGTAWARAVDANSSARVVSGLSVRVTEGTVNGETVWYLATVDPIVLDTTELTFTNPMADAGASVSSATPQAIGVAAAGVSADASRADHVHALGSVATSSVTGLDAALTARALTATTITTTAPLTIGGGTSADLGANRTIAIIPATVSVPGSMSAADKAKVDGVEALADVTDFANVSAALAAATANVAFNARKLTGVLDPTAAQDAATKTYTDLQDRQIAAVSVTGAAYTVLATDAGKWLECDRATAQSITIDGNVCAAGDVILFEQVGAGQITFVQGASMTLRKDAATLKSYAQYSVIGLRFKSATEATLFGALAAT